MLQLLIYYIVFVRDSIYNFDNFDLLNKIKYIKIFHNIFFSIGRFQNILNIIILSVYWSKLVYGA